MPGVSASVTFIVTPTVVDFTGPLVLTGGGTLRGTLSAPGMQLNGGVFTLANNLTLLSTGAVRLGAIHAPGTPYSLTVNSGAVATKLGAFTFRLMYVNELVEQGDTFDFESVTVA